MCSTSVYHQGGTASCGRTSPPPATQKAPLNPKALAFGSDRASERGSSIASSSGERSPPTCTSDGESPKASLGLPSEEDAAQAGPMSSGDGLSSQVAYGLHPVGAMASPSQMLPEGIRLEVDTRPSTSGRDTIPAPSGINLQRQHSNGSGHGRPYRGGSPPPLPVHPGVLTYGYGTAYPIYPFVTEPLERAASPPAMYPHPGGGSPPMIFNGGSPPLPSGFVSVPVLDRSSPVGHLPGGSPPHHHYPHYGSSPPMPGSPPPGMVFHPMPFHMPSPHSGGHPAGEYSVGMHHGHGYPPQSAALQHEELLQRMASLTGLGGQQQQTSAGRSEGRASARIARSHRAGGAYNASDFVFNMEEAQSGQGRTTLMIRNIPNKYTQEQMISVLHNAGFAGSYDFLYLPVDFRNKCNLGYCFVNFTTSQATAHLYREFHQKRWDELSSRKVCEVTFARVQGLDALLQHFRAAKFPSADKDLMPLVFTEREGDVASNPVAMHEYLSQLEEKEAAAAGATAAAGPEAEQ